LLDDGIIGPFPSHVVAQIDRLAAAKIKADLAQRLDDWMTQQADKGNKTELQAKTRQGRSNKAKPKAKAATQ